MLFRGKLDLFVVGLCRDLSGFIPAGLTPFAAGDGCNAGNPAHNSDLLFDEAEVRIDREKKLDWNCPAF
ncbi:MAG TPA: hypothetical protein VN663_08000 [Ramlibacter sp.]|nr:hypothetical protein [Ramlibacter sp.]